MGEAKHRCVCAARGYRDIENDCTACIQTITAAGSNRQRVAAVEKDGMPEQTVNAAVVHTQMASSEQLPQGTANARQTAMLPQVRHKPQHIIRKGCQRKTRSWHL